MPIHKWCVVFPATPLLTSRFSREELLTYARVAVIATLPSGDPDGDVSADWSDNPLTGIPMVRAWVRVSGAGLVVLSSDPSPSTIEEVNAAPPSLKSVPSPVIDPRDR